MMLTDPVQCLKAQFFRQLLISLHLKFIIIIIIIINNNSFVEKYT